MPKKIQKSAWCQALLQELETYLLTIDPKLRCEGRGKGEVSLLKHFGRKFRNDYFLPNLMLIIEVNGGQNLQNGTGRHTSGNLARKGGMVTNYENDLTKSNLSQISGLTYLQYTYEQLMRREYLKDISLYIKLCEEFKEYLPIRKKLYYEAIRIKTKP